MSRKSHESNDDWEVVDYWPETDIFNDKPIIDINSDTLTNPSATALLIAQPADRNIFYEENKFSYNSKVSPFVDAAFQQLLHFKDLQSVDTLVIGAWGRRHTDSTDLHDLLELITQNWQVFSHIKALFIGGVPLNRADIHDIQLCKLDNVLNTLADLEYLKVRGAPNQPHMAKEERFLQIADDFTMFFEEPIDHPALKKLVIETADMDVKTIQNLAASTLPQLEYLELWFGSYYYNRQQEEDILKALSLMLDNDFPNLKHLGLRNAIQADDFAILLADSPLLLQLDALDLSLGNLTGKGAQALLSSPLTSQLKQLDIYHHAIKKPGICRQLARKIPKVDYRLESMQMINDRFNKDEYNIFMYE